MPMLVHGQRPTSDALSLQPYAVVQVNSESVQYPKGLFARFKTRSKNKGAFEQCSTEQPQRFRKQRILPDEVNGTSTDLTFAEKAQVVS